MRSHTFVLLLLVACSRHAGEGERDRKGKATTAPDPPPPPTIAPALAMPVDTTVYRVPVDTSPARGKATALVTIATFSDFECKFCRIVEPVLASVRMKYGDDLRFVWKNEIIATHTHARAAAELAFEALDEKGNNGFWAVHDDLYASKSNALDDDTLLTIESTNAINTTKAQQAIAKMKHQTRFDDDHKLAVNVGATGIPTFFINGRRLIGAHTIEELSSVIDDELSKAQALVASGTARDKVYDAVMATATK